MQYFSTQDLLTTFTLPIAKITFGYDNSWLAIQNKIFMKMAIEKNGHSDFQMHSKFLFSGRINRQKHQHEYTDKTLTST